LLRWWFQSELARAARYFPPQGVKLFIELALLRCPLLIKGLPGLCDRHHQGNRPTPQRTDYQFHCVYGLQALHATCSADKAYYFVRQVWRVAVAQQY
jgi:hypothetical protein